MVKRTQWKIRDAKWNELRRMAVNHGLHIRPRTVYLAMNEALDIRRETMPSVKLAM
jgi:hypothetical protein